MPRSANVSAMSEVECRVLTREAFAQFDLEAPVIRIRLLQNLAQGCDQRCSRPSANWRP